jgi:hypothetical protein
VITRLGGCPLGDGGCDHLQHREPAEVLAVQVPLVEIASLEVLYVDAVALQDLSHPIERGHLPVEAGQLPRRCGRGRDWHWWSPLLDADRSRWTHPMMASACGLDVQ